MASTGFSAATREYRLDGGAWTAYTAPVTVSAPGRHTVEYRGTNAAGTTEVRSTTFTIGAVTDTPGTVGGTVPATLVAHARRAGDVRRVHAGRGARVHGVHDGERHQHRR